MIFIFLKCWKLNHSILRGGNVIIAPHSTFIRNDFSKSLKNILSSFTFMSLMKSNIPLSAEINMSTLEDGLSNINQIISTLSETKSRTNMTYETTKLVDIIINTATFQVAEVETVLAKYETIDKPTRARRSSANPLHAVGRFADWAFGLTSQEHFEEIKNSFEKNLKSLRNDDKLLAEAVKENSRELEEYSELLKQFDNLLKNISANDDKVVRTDRLFLKVLKHKFNLDYYMDSVSERLAMLSEILDQADLGLASRFMFSDRNLKAELSRVLEPYPGLQPVLGTQQVWEYLRQPLTLTHFTRQRVRSLLRVPLTEGRDAVFSINQQHSQGGLISLENSQYQVVLKLSQYKQRCLRRARAEPTFCVVRPCLLRGEGRRAGVSCLAGNDTTFLLTASKPFLVTTTCSGERPRVTNIANTTSLQLPADCKLESEYLEIRKVLTPGRRDHQGSAGFLATDASDHRDLQYLTGRKTEEKDEDEVSEYPPHLNRLLVAGVCSVVVGVLATTALAIFLYTRINNSQSSSQPDKPQAGVE